MPASEQTSIRSKIADPQSVDRLVTTELGTDIGFLLARMSARVSSHGNRSLAPFGLNVRSYSVLALSCSEEAPTQRECADFLSLDPSRVVALVDELENRGLLRRVPSTRDRRVKSLRATDAGLELFAAAHEATKAAERQALEHLLPADVERLRTQLHEGALFEENNAN